ncbi:MAG TPA: S9 family peptidase [Thermoanaerobaculia bacterium]|nr:S9 family peptidase [Thermoanaerobaculia bacterium]
MPLPYHRMPFFRLMCNRSQAAVAAALFGLIFGAVLLVPRALPAAEKRLITETDLFRFVWVADPRISPDGKQVVFVRVTVNKKKEGYDTALWIVPTDASQPPRPFTAGLHDSSPRWSPDGRWIAFERSAEGKPDAPSEPSQIWLIAAAGGEAVPLTDLVKGAGEPVWSPDGKTIAFIARANDQDLAKQEKQKKPEKADEEHESDVRVITRAIYRINGVGYLDPARPGHLWTVAVPAVAGAPLPKPRQITHGTWNEREPEWSSDGSLLYFNSSHVKEEYYQSPDSDLWSVPTAGGEPQKVVDINGPIREFALSRDGKSVAFTGFLNGDKTRSYDQPDLFVAPLGGGGARNLAADFDFDVEGGVSGDQHAPRGGKPTPVLWSGDGKYVITSTLERGRGNLRRFDAATGATELLTEGDHEVVAYSATPDTSRLALVISTPTVIGDLYALDVAGSPAKAGKPRRLTGFNDELFSGLNLTAPEEIEYPSFDGRKIEAWIQKPPNFDPAKKYPVILDIHGGPHTAYGYTFFHEFQWMAAKGYIVLYPNPRGSSAYGQEFGNSIQFHYPGDDYKDLMAGLDELIRRGLVDPQKQGVTGGSGGGILTNWIVTQTDRFAAAVAQRSIADWSAFWYIADFAQFQTTWFRGAPWEDPQDFAARSPITFVNKVKTPLMLIEGEADFRTPSASGGEQMFRALKYRKIPTVMVRFPGETHELSRSGRPWHRVERLQHIVAWFDKYLQGQKIDTYDVP